MIAGCLLARETEPIVGTEGLILTLLTDDDWINASTQMILIFNQMSCLFMSPVMRNPDFCLCENKGADQLHEADQRLCFHYKDSTIFHLPKSEISNFLPASVTVLVGLCRTWSETLNAGFLALQLL